MLLLFLSFLGTDFTALVDTSHQALIQLCFLVSIKLIVLPSILFWTAVAIIPDYAVPILLLSGISTGVVAPFIATLVAAKVAHVLRMVMVTSLFVPFTLPCLVRLLAGADLSIPLEPMIRLLAVVILLPMLAVLCARRLAPAILKKFEKVRFPISLVLFVLINFGVFSNYSTFCFQHPREILVSLAVAYAISLIYWLTGYIVTSGPEVGIKLSGSVSLAVMNNVLVIVFSSRFFDPLAPLLAAMYMFPFYTMIVPVNIFADRMRTSAWRT